jgi:hypothetical protein
MGDTRGATSAVSLPQPVHPGYPGLPRTPLDICLRPGAAPGIRLGDPLDDSALR